MHRRAFAAALLAALAVALSAQQPQPEVSQKDEPVLFRSRVDLVAVPVVVRDRQGKAVASLKQENFQLSDRGQPQRIARFSLEKAGSRTVRPVEVEAADPSATGAPASPAIEVADSFTALVFDDVHLTGGNLSHAREAAAHYLDESLAARKSERFAVYTTSGATLLDFTSGPEQLRAALLQVRQRPRGGGCPQMTLYMADLVANKRDPDAARAFSDDIECNAREVLLREDMLTRQTLSTIRQAVLRLAVMPGKRSVILLSPGFFTLERHAVEKTGILDSAIRAGVFLNSLDARGLYNVYTDAGQFTSNQILNRLQSDGALRDAAIMAEFADGTGGTFVEKTNDFEAGLRKLASPPESYYLLAFTPQNLRMDGSFHPLKVSLSGSREFEGMTLTARKGYYAPTETGNAADIAHREVEAALFSREEVSDIPAELHTQFFKTGADAARITLLIRLDVRKLKYRKENGRNHDEVTVVCGFFDRNGVLVTGSNKHVELHLRDETIEKQLAGGLVVRNTVDVKPGIYTIRMVVRDAEGTMMTARNTGLEIP